MLCLFIPLIISTSTSTILIIREMNEECRCRKVRYLVKKNLLHCALKSRKTREYEYVKENKYRISHKYKYKV